MVYSLTRRECTKTMKEKDNVWLVAEMIAEEINRLMDAGYILFDENGERVKYHHIIDEDEMSICRILNDVSISTIIHYEDWMNHEAIMKDIICLYDAWSMITPASVVSLLSMIDGVPDV